MPVGPLGQKITFQLVEPPAKAGWFPLAVNPGDTVQKIATRRGYIERAREIADYNGIRRVTSPLGRRSLQVPRAWHIVDQFHVYAGDTPPAVTDGYANWEVLDRPGRVGITQFQGYNPIGLEVPVRFESDDRNDEAGGLDIEADIRLLERMAGRGIGTEETGPGPATPPGIVRVTATKAGKIVPLFGANYAQHPTNPNPPEYVITGIDWGDAWRNSHGNRIRQLATVTLWQYVRSGVRLKAR